MIPDTLDRKRLNDVSLFLYDIYMLVYFCPMSVIWLEPE